MTSATIGDPVALYDGTPPGSEGWTQPEQRYFAEQFQTEVITNVIDPALIPVLPEQPNGTAVVIAPGGGYHCLSIESEGMEVAHWLARRGVTAFVLKYRLVQSDGDAVADLIEKMMAGTAETAMATVAPLAAADGETAMRWVRANAASYRIDPDRVGFVGFSAGGNVLVRVAYTSDEAALPGFIAPIYASVRTFALDPPPAGSGPAFIVAATDDQLGLAGDSVNIYQRWRQSGLSAELHMYASGGHGFGMRSQGIPTDHWIDRFGDWLGATGLVD